MAFAHGSYEEDNNNHNNNNKIENSTEHQNFVQLVFNETRSLGLEIFRNQNGVVNVKRVSEGGQAESICIDTLLEPEVLDDAILVAINGVPFDARDTGIQLYNELKSRARPKNIVFALRTTNMPDVKHAFCVNKIRSGKFIEFVFWKDIMGVRVNQKQDENFLMVDSIDEKTEAADIIQQCLLDPNVFKGASIIGVNGRKYKKKSAMFTALTTPNRPKFVLFELSQSLNSSSLYDTTASAKPPTKHAKFETPEKGIKRKVPLTLEDMNGNDSNVSLIQKDDETSPSSPESPRKKSATMLEKAVYASKSMRQLAVAVDDNDEDAGTSSTTSSPRSPSPRRQIHEAGQAESMTDSKRNLEICLDEMEKLNLQIDEEAENQRKLEASMARMQELNRENERSVSISSPTDFRHSMDNGGGSSENWSNARDQMISPRSLKARAILRGFKNKIGTTSFGGPADEDEEDEEEAAEHHRLKQEAYEACIKAIRDHLDAFLAETPDVSYEEWIEELHPENAKARRNYVKGRVIDHRFYVENSDHRKLWNEHLEEDGANGGVTIRQYVPIREYVPFGDRYNDNNANVTPQTKKSLSFKRKSDVPDRRTSALKF